MSRVRAPETQGGGGKNTKDRRGGEERGRGRGLCASDSPLKKELGPTITGNRGVGDERGGKAAVHGGETMADKREG